MEIRYIPREEITAAQQEMLDGIELTCFGFSSAERLANTEEGYPFADDIGAFPLLDDDQIARNAFVYKRQSEYDGQSYCLGGLGGLAILPGCRGKGHARQLAEKTLRMCYDIGVDIACLFMDREDSLSKFYESLGYAFIDRRGYYFD